MSELRASLNEEQSFNKDGLLSRTGNNKGLTPSTLPDVFPNSPYRCVNV